MVKIRSRARQILGTKPPESDDGGCESGCDFIHAHGFMDEDIDGEPLTPDADTTIDETDFIPEELPAVSRATVPLLSSGSPPSSGNRDGLHPSVYILQLGADTIGISDQLSKFFVGRGVSHRSFDLHSDDAKSLLDTSCWETFLGNTRDENLHFAILAPPSLTFLNSPMHGPLRARLGPGIYGGKISSDLKSHVNVENVMWIRSAQIAAVLHGRGIPWVMVIHLSSQFCSYPSDLHEVSQVLNMPGVSAYFHGQRDHSGRLVGDAVNIHA